MIECFPVTERIKAYREQQLEIANWLEAGINEGKTKFIICAPTGSGKSAVSKMVGNYFAKLGKTTLITSPLNTLVDQYEEYTTDKNGKPLVTLKGKSNYVCKARYELRGGVLENCDNGFCAGKICSMDYDAGRKVVYKKRNCKECVQECPCKECNYKAVMRAFKTSDIGNTNFTLLQMGVVNGQESGPDCLIVDEADYIEPFIRMFRTVTIPEYWDFDWDAQLACLDDLAENLEYELNHINISPDNIRRKKYLESQVYKIRALLNDFTVHQEKWIVKHNNEKSTTYEPVSINRFIEDALKTDERTVILMSATPEKLDGWEFLEVKSPFPADIRPIKHIPVGSMSLKNRAETIPKLAEFLRNGYLKWLMPGKTIVHVPSYAVAFGLYQEVVIQSRGLVVPIVQTRECSEDSVDGATLRKDVIEKFKNSSEPWQILIAVNMGRGIDLPEIGIKNNIITFLKRPNPTDPLVKAKMRYLGGDWSFTECGNDLMQQYGRINRNNDKITNTIITEPEFEKFMRLHDNKLREWFKEAIVEGEKKDANNRRNCVRGPWNRNR